MVKKHTPDRAKNVEYFRMDASHEKCPESDIALAMGVTPYVEDIDSFYDNILPSTNVFYCLSLDPNHWANLTRRLLPILNVRNMRCVDRQKIDSLLEKHNWTLIERRDFASGYLDVAIRSPQSSIRDVGVS